MMTNIKKRLLLVLGLILVVACPATTACFADDSNDNPEAKLPPTVVHKDPRKDPKTDPKAEPKNCFITIEYLKKTDETVTKTFSSFTKTEKECKVRAKNHETNFEPYAVKKKTVKYHWDK